MRKLTLPQRRFVEILFSMEKPNQRKAYEQVYACRGKTADVEAHRTLKLPQVKAYLKKLQKKSEERAIKSAADIIAELELVGFSNIKNYLTFGPDGVVLKNSDELTAGQLAAVAEVSETTGKHGGTKKIKLYDKLKALKDLGLRYGIFPTKVELPGELTLAQALHNALKDKRKEKK
jgi:phage terminase small subunit